ncbi:hypothetical protein LEP1GSC081_4459 [Leptospira kirschneri str. H1]|uniref:Uncharacterized protein n=1 Tax=Leptospira kirschneri str. H1 TaxID=1049966 RepID=A0A0E2B330_9LEPT|nr:hypothetical protein LEP1GSC081_4459 [Leptospira kirschneri str. H1]
MKLSKVLSALIDCMYFFLLLKRKWIETKAVAQAFGSLNKFLSLIKEEVD